MLTGIDTLLVVKPTGLFFLKQQLEEFTTSDGLEQITHAVNVALSGHREVHPCFSFQKTDEGYVLHIWNPGYGKRDNIWIAGVKLVVKKASRGYDDLLVVFGSQEVRETTCS